MKVNLPETIRLIKEAAFTAAVLQTGIATVQCPMELVEAFHSFSLIGSHEKSTHRNL